MKAFAIQVAFVLAVIATQAYGLNVTLSVDPEKKIVPGLTPTLLVNCTVKPGEQSAVEIATNIELSLNDTTLATLGFTSNDQVTEVNNTEGFTFSGHLRFQDKFGYLAMKVDYPDETSAGIYKCTVGGLKSDNAHDEYFDEKTVGIAGEPTVSDLLEILQTHDKLLQQLTGGSVSPGTGTGSGGSSQALRDFEAALFTFPFKPPNGPTYLLSKSFMRNVYIAQAICRAAGGNLVEMADATEYQIVKNYLMFEYAEMPVLIGIKYQEYLKQWTLVSNGQTANFTEWSRPPAATPGNELCVTLESPDWKMTNVPCDDNQAKTLFMCEVEHFN